ncbi:hypothetical protein PHYSODRAFT_335497 [Phytophthora sojae]|uniref:Necrosis inducing-like protein NPP1 type n=1 Tax=Phytophthora sojae (strain P6497) TaxID=1094619 RepID=G4ZVD8_PHYSP|nr:hypothetical protein PHYSODRAFT_335497 [Phytophthora sojae]EGZ13762.1 hypothetical protein PHYSODRAFT_335497 [Phytophthora sojae]|eukprot:XP_009531191.1 hypothetical protein PHYSODRAFT_335497 [Phytophthora sojae]
MKLLVVALVCITLLCSVVGATIIHDQVKPFAQPVPVTISEKAAVKYKPQLFTYDRCESFPAVNAAGEVTGGLKGTKGKKGCEKAPRGSQVYGRSGWYQDKWPMMFAWYFQKNVKGHASKKRHDWANMGWIKLEVAYADGKSQDLIMWEQLTDAARECLNSADFEDTKISEKQRASRTTRSAARRGRQSRERAVARYEGHTFGILGTSSRLDANEKTRSKTESDDEKTSTGEHEQPVTMRDERGVMTFADD